MLIKDCKKTLLCFFTVSPFLRGWKKRCRISELSRVRLALRGVPEAKAFVLVLEFALKPKNRFFLRCRSQNTSYSLALPPRKASIFRFIGPLDFLIGYFE